MWASDGAYERAVSGMPVWEKGGVMKRHLYTVPAALLARWRQLGWKPVAQPPREVIGPNILVENTDRWPLFPCRNDECEQELSQQGYASRGGWCQQCDDERDAVVVTVH